MKKIATVIEVAGEGFEMLLDKRVELYCLNYIYSGVLSGVNTTCVLLTDAYIVYATGAFNSDKFADAQKLSHDLYVQVSSIESFKETNKK